MTYILVFNLFDIRALHKVFCISQQTFINWATYSEHSVTYVLLNRVHAEPRCGGCGDCSCVGLDPEGEVRRAEEPQLHAAEEHGRGRKGRAALRKGRSFDLMQSANGVPFASSFSN